MTIAILSLSLLVGGLVFGFDTGVIGGVLIMDGFRDEFGYPRKVSGEDDPDWLSTRLGLIVALLSIGCFTGACFGGPMADRFGRKPATLMGALICSTGSLFQAVASQEWMLFCGRAVAGLGIGCLRYREGVVAIPSSVVSGLRPSLMTRVHCILTPK